MKKPPCGGWCDGLIWPCFDLQFRGMDAATLYMIVALPNGQMRTYHWSENSVGQCEDKIRHLARKDNKSGKSLKIMGWCRGESVLVIAH